MRYLARVWVAGETVWSLYITHAIPERIRGGLRWCAIQIDVYFYTYFICTWNCVLSHLKYLPSILCGLYVCSLFKAAKAERIYSTPCEFTLYLFAPIIAHLSNRWLSSPVAALRSHKQRTWRYHTLPPCAQWVFPCISPGGATAQCYWDTRCSLRL